MAKTEREKMLDNKPYLAMDPELTALNAIAQRLLPFDIAANGSLTQGLRFACNDRGFCRQAF
jgi:hypothetical protein